MNYLEAVKELVNNPLAACIRFDSKSDPRGYRQIELEKKQDLAGNRWDVLIFPATAHKRKQNVVATCTDFLLREDFYVVYQAVKKTFEDGYFEGYCTGRNKGKEEGLNSALYKMKRDEAAFEKFKKDWAEKVAKGIREILES